MSNDQRTARKSLKDELAQYKAQFLNKLKGESEPLIAQRDGLKTEIIALSSEKADIKAEVNRSSEKLRLLVEETSRVEKRISVLQDEESSLKGDVRDSMDELSVIKDKLAKTEENLSDATVLSRQSKIAELSEDLLGTSMSLANSIKITELQRKLDDLQADYETREKAADGELRSILLKTSDALKRLKDIEEKEIEIRASLASERQAIQRERAMLEIREAKVSASETRALKHARLMKL